MGEGQRRASGSEDVRRRAKGRFVCGVQVGVEH